MEKTENIKHRKKYLIKANTAKLQKYNSDMYVYIYIYVHRYMIYDSKKTKVVWFSLNMRKFGSSFVVQLLESSYMAKVFLDC